MTVRCGAFSASGNFCGGRDDTVGSVLGAVLTAAQNEALETSACASMCTIITMDPPGH
jgi:hypothetical protein